MKVMLMKIDILEMPFYWIMVQYILVNGQVIKNLAKEFKYGKMVQYMKDFGLGIWQMVKEDCIMQMVIFMMEYNFVLLLGLGRS